MSSIRLFCFVVSLIYTVFTYGCSSAYDIDSPPKEGFSVVESGSKEVTGSVGVQLNVNTSPDDRSFIPDPTPLTTYGIDELRQEISMLPMKFIEWQNIIDPDKYGLIRQVICGYDHLYIETENKYLFLLNRRTRELEGGITSCAVALDHPIKWIPVEDPNIPAEIAKLKADYKDVQSQIDLLYKQENPDTNKLTQLKLKRKEINELHAIKTVNDNFYFVSGNDLHCFQRSKPHKEKWYADLSFIAGTQPFASGGLAFIGGIKYSRIFMLEAQKGALNGDFRPMLTRQNRIYHHPTAELPYVYFSSEDKYLSCYHINRQSYPEWKYKMVGDPSTPPKLVNTSYKYGNITQNMKLVLLGSKDLSIYAVNAISGTKVWQARCESEPEGEIYSLSNQTVLVHTLNNYIINLRLTPMTIDSNGKVLGFNDFGEVNWKVSGIKRFVLEGDDFILLETTEGVLRHVNKNTGELIQDIRTVIISTFVTNPFDKILYAITSNGMIIALSDR